MSDGNLLSDRNLGYLVLGILLLLLGIPAVSLSVRALKPTYRTVVVFPSANTLNFLKKQDEVKIRGVRVGTVEKCCRRNGKTCVEIVTAHRLDLHRGYRITAQPSGFMGNRYLEIEPGDPRLPLVAPEEELIGRFPPGAVEAIAHADSMIAKLRRVIGAADTFLAGTPTRPPFAKRFRNKAGEVDATSARLVGALFRADSALAGAAETLAVSLKRADSLSASLGNSMRPAESAAVAFEAKSRRSLRAADSIVSLLTAKLHAPDIRESEALSRAVDSVKARLEALKRLSEELRRSGVKVKL